MQGHSRLPVTYLARNCHSPRSKDSRIAVHQPAEPARSHVIVRCPAPLCSAPQQSSAVPTCPGNCAQAIRGFADELLRARAAITRAAAAAAAKSSSTPGSAAAPTEALAVLGRKGSPPTQQLQPLPPRMARVVWLMHGYRPAPLPDPCFPNTLSRMVCLQHLALRELERAGVVIVDLATMEMDAPAHWFYDAVHLAGAGGDVKRWGSGLELMAVQMLLNSVCGAGAE